MEIEDRHSIYVMANGHTQEEVHAHIDRWISSDAVQDALEKDNASDWYMLSLATNYEGHFLGYGFIYCMSPSLYHVLLGRQPTGLHGVLVSDAQPPYEPPTPPSWDAPAKRFNWADDTDRCFPPKRLEPRSPLFSTEDTFITLKPARISSDTQTRYLRATSVPEKITPKMVWDVAHIYTQHLEVIMCTDRNDILLVFPEMTNDANFAAFFLRKVYLPGTTTPLVFRTLRPDEPTPIFKSFERYVPE